MVLHTVRPGRSSKPCALNRNDISFDLEVTQAKILIDLNDHELMTNITYLTPGLHKNYFGNNLLVHHTEHYVKVLAQRKQDLQLELYFHWMLHPALKNSILSLKLVI